MKYESHIHSKKYFHPLGGKNLLTIPQCKNWLIQNGYGYEDNPNYTVRDKSSKLPGMRVKKVRRFRIEFSPICVCDSNSFQSNWLTAMNFRQMVTWLCVNIRI